MPDASVTLDDKYRLESGRVFLTGTQALVRLPMMQRQRDFKAGLNTAGFISGYRGSPLGMYDQQLWQARKFLKENHIHFQPGVNEDLAATAVWGTQQQSIFNDGKYDGIFSIWYGKGPGVDRCGDVFRHGNMAGSAKHGGVLLLAGDDHAAKSSTTAHQCEYAFMDAMVPTLSPAGVQDFLDLGIYGWALSRYSGCWVGFKCVGETVEATASVHVDPHRVEIVIPKDFELPPDGLNIRWAGGLDMVQQEERLHYHKLYAALAFARANKFNRIMLDSPKRRFGIVASGKAYLDVRQALDDLGIDEAMAADIGLSLYKVGMVWPLERDGMREFAEGLEEVLVVEEKRAVIENQLKEQLYNWREDVRPRVIGKFDEKREWILPSSGELTPARIARVIADRIKRFYTNPKIEERLAWLANKERALEGEPSPIKRVPTFCSGCPHNTSTKVPEGSRAAAGIGCHYMALWADRNTSTFTQMGGEGAPWVGMAPFSNTKHIFQNLGDGTYFHSGLLAIRQAVAAKVNITYKILYNDAVAMTGGQQVDGPLDPPMISRQLAAEGVKKIVVVADEPDKYPIGTDWAPGVTIEHRDHLDRVQRDLRELEGVTALIYDQVCAAEKRRRRKRGLYPDPPKRAFINDLVCEGCGDCSVKSNCVSVLPLETEFGRKRQIDQSSCNKDYSCVKGFCPSFVTVHGGGLKKSKGSGSREVAAWPLLSEPTLPQLTKPYDILVTGVGGTGVVTIGALLGMAAHIEGYGCSVLDQTGLAQKGGSVMSHIRIAPKPEDIHAVRISAGGAELLIGCDLVVAASFDGRAKLAEGKSVAVVDSYEQITSDFTRNPDFQMQGEKLQDLIRHATGPKNAHFVEAHKLATALMGDSIATNLFILGYAWQKGLVPLSAKALEQAIDLNGVAVAFNKQAFLWGRRAAEDLAAVKRVAEPKAQAAPLAEKTFEQRFAERQAFLTAYQNAAYAARYRALVEKVAAAEKARVPGSMALTEAAMRYFFKLMAVKDEWEVARLYSDGTFLAKVRETFAGDFKLHFHLAPPLMARRDPESGELIKKEYGPKMLWAFRLMASLRFLRGTLLDPFRLTAERKMERRLIADYEALVEKVLAMLDASNHPLAVQLFSIPEEIRGFGHVKEAHLKKAKAKEAGLLSAFEAPQRQAAE